MTNLKAKGQSCVYAPVESFEYTIVAASEMLISNCVVSMSVLVF